MIFAIILSCCSLHATKVFIFADGTIQLVRPKCSFWSDIFKDDGFLLLYKRLEDGKFSWPRNEQEVRNITREQFIWLMQGLSIDQPKAIKK